MNIDNDGFFWKIRDGRLPRPACSQTLGAVFHEVSPEEGVIRAEFDGKPEFANPVGNIQGGFLAAMLDETMGPALASTLRAGEFAPTLDLNVSFLRPAKIGKLEARSRMVRRGREVCFLAAELLQGGKVVATATATFLIRKDSAAG